jgi:hypothetical protein
LLFLMPNDAFPVFAVIFPLSDKFDLAPLSHNERLIVC